MTKKASNKVSQALIITLLLVLSLAQIFPFLLQITTSLMPIDFSPEYGKIYLFPTSYNFSNYIEAIERVQLLQGVFNSLIVCFGYLFISSIMILLMGYTLSKKKFSGKKIIYGAMLLTMVAPGEMMMVTNYKLISDLGWINSYAALILPGVVNITGIFLVMAFMNGIPSSVLEYSDIEGANELKKLISIVLPMSLPVLSTYWILNFVAQWNDYLWPMVVTGSPALYTVQLKLKEFNPYYEGYGDEVLKSAGHLVSFIPVLTVYLLCQKKFVAGLSISGLK